MPKTFIRTIFLFLCLFAVFAGKGLVSAQGVQNENVVTFEQLNVGRQTLQGQFDQIDFFLTIPADWQLLPGAQLELDITTFVNQLTLAEAGTFGGVLEIYFEGVLLQTVIVERSEFQTVVLDIPTIALADPDDNGRFRVQFIYEGAGSCEIGPTATSYVLLQPTSRFILPHETVSPTTDLRQLPRPFYQRSFVPDEALIVVANAPTAGELQAALRIAAALGRMSRGNLLLTLVAASNLLPEVRDNQNLIIVGQADQLPLGGATPLTLTEALPAGGAEDGILHLGLSPWNERKVVLYVTGNTETALNKAAVALSTGFIRTAEQPNLAVIQEVFPERLLSGTDAQINTLQDMGYETQLVEGIGARQVTVEFFVPPQQTVDTEIGAFFNLVYAHSSLLDFDRSAVNVEVNGERIGSVRLEGESTVLTNASLPIPADAVHPGRNTLHINADLRPRSSCNDQQIEQVWLTIRSESSLALPLRPLDNQAQPAEELLLSRYPRPFSFDPTLATTAFVVPPADPFAWQQAAEIAFDLGTRVEGGLVGLNLAFANDVPEEMRQQSDLIVIGRATTLPVLAEINDDLPAPFADDSDAVQDEQLLVAYSVPAGSELGYLQMLAAPWNPARIIVAVNGNSETGLQNATAALINTPLRRDLKSDFAVIEGQEAYLAVRVQEPALVPTATPSPLSTEPPAVPVTATQTPRPAVEAIEETPSPTTLPPVVEPADTGDALTDNPLFLVGIGVAALVVIVAAGIFSRRFW